MQKQVMWEFDMQKLLHYHGLSLGIACIILKELFLCTCVRFWLAIEVFE